MTETNLHEYIVLTKDEFLEPISSGYAKMVENAPDEDLIDNYNPGPTKADGSVNFECHCVSHMVASPCGFEFREAISCQRNASEEDLKAGACVDQFIRFMDCTMETGCFKKKADAEEKSAEEQSKEK
ncbi:CHCH domain-containing protein [Aphelenchoides bicaudatus]|nr:CHCH domain-containing protein [Aphelenchoides bicaudatus]